MPKPDYVNVGDRESAADHNKLIDAANRQLIGGGGFTDEHGHGATEYISPEIKLFELVGAIEGEDAGLPISVTDCDYQPSWREMTVMAHPVKQILGHTPGDNFYVVDSEAPMVELWMPQGPHAGVMNTRVGDPTPAGLEGGEGMSPPWRMKGHRVFAIKLTTHWWIINQMPLQFRFKLLENLTPGGTAWAIPDVLDYHGLIAPNINVEYLLRDPTGYWNADVGTHCLAQYSHASGYWEILYVQPMIMAITCRSTAPVGAFDPIPVNNVSSMYPGITWPSYDRQAPTYVANSFNWELPESGVFIYAVWQGSRGGVGNYIAIQAGCDPIIA